MLVAAIEATRQLESTARLVRGYRFQDVRFSKLLTIPKNSQGIETQLRLRKDDDNSSDDEIKYEILLYANEHEDWHRCCHGSIVLEYHDDDLDTLDSALASHEHIADLCQLPISCDQFYRDLRNSGLDYGPAFRNITQLYGGDSQSGIGEVDIRIESCPKGRAQNLKCLIHPAALDCIFQVAFSGLSRGGEIEMPTYVPTEIKSLWLSARLSRRNQHDSLVRVSTDVLPQGSRACNVSYVTLWKDNKQPSVIGDLTLTSIGGAKEMTQTSGPVSLYHMVLKPDVNLLSSESKGLPFVVDRAETKSENVEDILLTESACFLAISGVLKAVTQGEDQSEKPEYLQKYVEWMRHQITMLEDSEANRHFLLKEHQAPNSEDKILEEVGELGPEGKLIAKLAKNLIPIVQGRIDALQVLFQDETLTEYYRQQNPPPEVYTSVQKYIDCMAHANPHLRVLEIGAGTGGMTTGILQALSVSESQPDRHYEEKFRFSEYMFTDVSPAFFQKANENFARNGFMCRVLDIEKAPEEQGYDLGSYDLIVASNVNMLSPSGQIRSNI